MLIRYKHFNIGAFNLNINIHKQVSDFAVNVLLRHGEREQNLSKYVGNEVTLTLDGEHACREWGSQNKDNIRSIYTSPVIRCVQTAELIAPISLKKNIQYSNLLGNPGVFISDAELAHNHFKQFSVNILVEKLLAATPNLPGFCCSTSEAIKQLIDYICDRPSQNGLHVFITHDSILAVVLGYFFPNMNLHSLWPDFLEGLFIIKHEKHIYLHYRNLSEVAEWS